MPFTSRPQWAHQVYSSSNLIPATNSSIHHTEDDSKVINGVQMWKVYSVVLFLRNYN